MNIPHSLPASAFRDGTPQKLSPDEEKLKRDLYEKIPARRRKFIDRIGYDNWDPFTKPNDPMEIRTDVSHRTTQQLIREFLQSRAAAEGKRPEYSNAYSQGALECAIGVVYRAVRSLGFCVFATWYHDLLPREGHFQDDGQHSSNAQQQSSEAASGNTEN